MNFKDKVLFYKNEVIQAIQELVQIKSVQEKAQHNMPFGYGPAKALNWCYEKAKKWNLNVTNYDNYVVEIEYGEGDESLAILCHVDVVPEGDNWIFEPYSGHIDNNKIYGRGTLDDKGPTAIILYCLKCLVDNNFRPNKKIRIIIGANEETGSKCLDYYFNKLKMPQPTLAFTPDSNFPVTYAEKTILRIKLKKYFKSLDTIEIKGGNAFNSVADKAYIIGKELFINYSNVNDHIKIDDNKIECFGKSSHAAKPEHGFNAISYLFDWLKDTKIRNPELKELVHEYNNLISTDFYGTNLEINNEDESGKLTLNVGMISLFNNKLEISIDIRSPVHNNIADLIQQIRKKTKYYFDFELIDLDKPLYVNKDSFLVQTLMQIYKNETKDYDSKPIAIGGGTYARWVNNGVAFGALLKDQIDNMHQANECLDIDKIDILLKIYIQAIYELSK